MRTLILRTDADGDENEEEEPDWLLIRRSRSSSIAVSDLEVRDDKTSIEGIAFLNWYALNASIFFFNFKFGLMFLADPLLTPPAVLILVAACKLLL